MTNEVEPISLTMSEQMQGYIHLIEWSRAKIEEYFNTIMITEEKNGQPALRPNSISNQ